MHHYQRNLSYGITTSTITVLDKARRFVLQLKKNNNTIINSKVDVCDYNHLGMGLGLITNDLIKKGCNNIL